ncbi:MULTISPECIES: ligase-associated DNA damage response DEXH box helicase [unclassified Paracoccus (in: a-proteobacteria)]|uniref:ligase-associated DNA damage response DEXH box helicase n=1 Tax=unclassified Paracoccus (in: a-proteobacteria) TaxID=2688777 RepID=UPI0012B1918F|nr:MULTISPECIES: ligase-associated DNA damage response DEXH box helicase [unclassified Paracoccus (in: a-proteobacteria)]UXU75480.1 ligase-associated DNA damage response DEXH box helicase [Paracoccus sp. SMMA_5]UXU81385.1 ligase-associated DNA damage response DEXH box helicase [Paracoccus sp. SMMA_5_TC]
MLPGAFRDWFARQGWQPHPHQLALLAATGDSLLIAPTGGGKTLAGFLPSLVELQQPQGGLHTLYVSPLKALTADIARNLRRPVAELELPLRIEDRTGDTAASQRRRQRRDPPDILLTTPESLALMLSYPEAPAIFGRLRRVVLDELHALAESKRGDQLMLGLARLRALAPGLRVTGLSATVDDPQALAGFMAGAAPVEIVAADPGPDPDIAMLPTARPAPWAGGGGHYAIPEVLAAVRQARTTIIFINTRAQAELFFQALWAANDDNLPIGLHHGSLAREQRQRVEAAMAAGQLRAVVATGSLDLGIDWGAVDLVIQVGAPKNVKRLVQRIGRANHRYNAPSRARIVPANRFEQIECVAALEAVQAGDLDGDPRGPGPLDVLCQHILLTACAGPFDADALYAEVRSAGPYRALTRSDFDACLDFAATGGYALRAYDRWQRLMLRDGRWRLRDPRAARLLRMNIGTIVEAEMMQVRLRGRGGAALGEVEEAFAATLSPGDSFLIGGRVVRMDALREMVVEVTPQPGAQPRIAVFSGLKLAMSTQLAHRVLALLGDPDRHPLLPADARDWLALQAQQSRLPEPGLLLSESFPHAGRWHFVLYGFAGRNALQTLGLLLTREMEADGLGPLGFLATDYALLVWSLDPVADPAPLLALSRLRGGLGDWLGDNAVMKRSFRTVATIAGLIQRNSPGQRKSGRQATFSSDILYDTLRRYDPDHLLLRITADEAGRGLVDFGRIEEMLARSPRREHRMLARVSPLAAPLLLEMGKVPIRGEGRERLAEREAEALMQAAGLDRLT